MKSKVWKAWLIVLLVVFLSVNAVLLVKYVFPPIIQLNKTYSSTNGPEGEFRGEVIDILNQKIQVPEDYTFYFDKKVYGGEAVGVVYIMYLHWEDKEGFDYLIEVESDEKLNKIAKINPTITKNSDYNLSFKDYVPNNYFSYGGNGFDFPQNNYLREESPTLKEIREDIDHISINTDNLRLKYLAIPGVAILSALPNQDLGIVETKVDAVAVISKDDEDYVYEYDYNGDGRLDETKIFSEFQDPSQIVEELAYHLNIDSILNNESTFPRLPGQRFDPAIGKVELGDHTIWHSNDLRTFIEYEADDRWIVTVTPDSETEKSEFWVGQFIEQE